MHVRVTDAAIENLDLHVVLAGITALKAEWRERRRGALDSVSIGFHKLIYFENCSIGARRNEWGEHPIRLIPRLWERERLSVRGMWGSKECSQWSMFNAL
jgi:hypothetical protein